MNVTFKIICSGLAIALTFAAFLPYIRGIVSGTTRPHVFSWIIWGSTTFVVFLAQLYDRGGAGAWPIGVSGAITIVIAILAYLNRSDITITRTDWLFFITALSSLPLWYMTANPLWSVIVLTMVDVLGFGPTFRKAYHEPGSESVVFYLLFSIRNLLVIVALEHYSVTTVLFPAVIAVACLILIGLIVYRRQALIKIDSQGV